VTSSRAIERLSRRDAGERSILCAPVPDHTVSARLCRRHIDKPVAVFATVLRRFHDVGLIRLGLVVLDGTKVTANASLDANRSAATIDEQVRRMLAEAESTDQGEDRRFGPKGRERLPPALSRRASRRRSMPVPPRSKRAGSLAPGPSRSRRRAASILSVWPTRPTRTAAS
jgi:hypothetical protein